MYVDPWVYRGTCPPYFLKWRGRSYRLRGPTSKGRVGEGGREMEAGRGREGRGEEGEEWGLIRASIRSPYFFADLRP